ncbi:MAG: sodium:proton antiporter NhaD [Parachlamydiales bacterium]
MSEVFSLASYILIVVFAAAYTAIVFEHSTKVNKAAAALIGAALCWFVIFVEGRAAHGASVSVLSEHVSSVSQIIFFLMGAMTIVELIDSHHGFQLIIDLMRTRSKTKMLWIIGLTTFFVSAVLDNLTSTIVMVSVLRKILPNKLERWFFGAIVVIAANAGGAWTPIGDVTTTMLWIHGNLSTLSVMRSLFIPSLVSLVVALIYGSFRYWGQKIEAFPRGEERLPHPGAKLTFFLGIGALILVPVIKGVTGLPPFMSMFIGVGILWMATDLRHAGHHDRDHLRMTHALTRIDTSGILFFLGILLAVGALEAAGILGALAGWVNTVIPNVEVVALLIGLASAVVDNVPLVAATMSMYDLTAFPIDSPFWDLIAYCAGTGGSILIIGSAAGVALMSLEKVDFFWYLRKISVVAFLSYAAGAGTYLLLGI